MAGKNGLIEAPRSKATHVSLYSGLQVIRASGAPSRHRGAYHELEYLPVRVSEFPGILPLVSPEVARSI